MYLVHNTDSDGLLAILNDGALKSSALTGLAENGQGAGLYDSNEFVYMHASEMLFDPTIKSPLTLYVRSSALSGRAFHVATAQTPQPDIQREWVGKRGAADNGYPGYRRSYPSTLCAADRDEVLRSLHRQSLRKRPRGLWYQHLFNQVAVRRSLDIRGSIAGVAIRTSADGDFSYEYDTVTLLRRRHPEIPIYIFYRQ